MENTRNLMEFSAAQLRIAGRLLSAFRDSRLDRTKFLGEIVTPELNPDSGYVFLIDSNFNIAMLNENWLEDHYRCENCNYEGFYADLKTSGKQCCLNHLHKKHEELKAA